MKARERSAGRPRDPSHHQKARERFAGRPRDPSRRQCPTTSDGCGLLCSRVVCRISTPRRPLKNHDLCPTTNYNVCPLSPDERRMWPSLPKSCVSHFRSTTAERRTWPSLLKSCVSRFRSLCVLVRHCKAHSPIRLITLLMITLIHHCKMYQPYAACATTNTRHLCQIIVNTV
jgi:hypothetical protein